MNNLKKTERMVEHGLTDELGQQIRMETGYNKCFGGVVGDG